MVRRIFDIIISLFFFFLAIKLIVVSFAHFGQESAVTIFNVTANPFVGLFIGLLTTAILQSSSTTTSMAVAFVAVDSLALSQAIPIIIGANIGTTLTSTIVSISYITKAKEFRKAITAGTVHDIYNILIAILIFPLELKYKVLTNLSTSISEAMPILSGPVRFSGISGIYGGLETLFINKVGPLITLIFAIVLLLATVKYISRQLYNRWTTRRKIENAFFKRTYRSFGWGLIFTSVVQSSSLTTSLMVPLVATGKLKIKRAFEFILGANLGTTITALLAALFQSEAAVSLAIAHFLFNLFGVTLFLIPFFSGIPTYMAKQLGLLTLRSRITGFAYILFTFFILPFTLIYFSNKRDKPTESYLQKEAIVEKPEARLED